LVLGTLGANGTRRVIVGTASSSIGAMAFYQKTGLRLHRGYAAGLTENGIPVRDMVWMDQTL